jgi:pentatricopeptide repeat protein
MIIFIDSGVLGVLANPRKIGEVHDCEEWLYRLLSRGIVPDSSKKRYIIRLM